MDFRLNEEQLLMQRMVRDFARKDVKPLAAKYDSEVDLHKRFPWELWQKAHKLGLVQLPLPSEWGGGGADFLTQVIVCEELGAGDGSFGKIIGINYHNLNYFNNLLNAEQKKEFIPKITEDDTCVICSSFTEPESATDNLLPYDAPGVAVKTFAYRDGDEYIINGMKRFATMSAVAKLYFVWVRTEKTKPITQALSCFLIPYGTPGFTRGHFNDEMGGKSDCRAELTLDNVRVPVSHRIGAENGMYGPRRDAFLVDYLFTVAAGIGEARSCYEETLEFAKTRVQGGKPIIEHINIGTKIANMCVVIESSRVLLYKIAWSADSRCDFDPKMVYLAKAHITDLLSKFYVDVMDIWAGLGVQKELPIERYFRNHFSTTHSGGTPDTNRIKAIKMLQS